MPPYQNRRTPPHKPTPAERHRHTTDAVTLLAAILTGSTPLPGAACTTQPEVFDLDGCNPTQAATLCNRCPARSRCTDWAATLRPGHASGVIAGKIHRYPNRAASTRKRVTA